MAGRWNLVICPGNLIVGVWWDGNPLSFAISLPFINLWYEHEGGQYWPWDWTILRVVLGDLPHRASGSITGWGSAEHRSIG